MEFHLDFFLYAQAFPPTILQKLRKIKINADDRKQKDRHVQSAGG
jgi:hypothetical protein